ncbi:MAG TPA: hypothetical protein DD670_20995 [Planctomycetaceae bacterium]|nr:hypothetical protein [Planctomycetaceae bacterium]
MTTASNRSAQFTKLHKVLKKHYKPVSVDANRPVLEHLVFACLLEDAHHGAAEEAFASLVEEYFDWNEIRVSSIRELTETLAKLPDPPAAAHRLKRSLQHVFETTYSFDLEGLRKKNLGPASEALTKIDGATNFGVAYVVQSALGGHAIPLDAGTLEVMRILDLATNQEIESGAIAGLERAIAKSKGVEFGSLLHQLGADFTLNPFAADLRGKLLEVDPEAKNRWPKRHTRKPKTESAPDAAPAGVEEAPGKQPPASETEPKKGSAARKKTAAAPKKPAVKKDSGVKKATTKRSSAAAKSESGRASSGKKTSSGGLSKRKPR